MFDGSIYSMAVPQHAAAASDYQTRRFSKFRSCFAFHCFKSFRTLNITTFSPRFSRTRAKISCWLCLPLCNFRACPSTYYYMCLINYHWFCVLTNYLYVWLINFISIRLALLQEKVLFYEISSAARFFV